jgi:hypothetical protein
MTDKTRFTLAKTGVIASGITGAFLLTACGGTATVSGRLDDTRYLPSRPAITVPAIHQVPVYTQQCKTKTKTVAGSGLKKSSTKTYQECKKVRTGYRSEHYTRTLRAAQDAVYCVELDNVGGHKHNDDQWYEVSSTTYYKWSHRPEGTKVNKMPYYRSVAHCWY